VPDLTQSADLVDAAVCVLAGDDFIGGRAMNLGDRSLAEREGWIWTAAPLIAAVMFTRHVAYSTLPMVG